MRPRASAVLGLLLLALSGCGAPTRGAAYDRSLAEARRAYHDGRFDAAAAGYEEAAKSAKVPRDAVFARYEAALTWARAGDVARAAAELRAIATSKPPTAYSAQAAYKAAELALASDEAAGVAELEAVALAFPESGVAQVALHRVIRHDDDASPDAALARLDRLAPRLRGTKLEETLLYERARRLDTLGRTEAAREAYLEVAGRFPYPFGAYNDDALFRAAEMEEKLGRPKEAASLLERLLAQREVSSFLGTYERGRYLPAMLGLARLYEEKLDDRKKAKETLHRLYAELTTSTMRDDALWREAALWQKDGDASTACGRLATLIREFPDSRYVPCAALQCPALERPAKSKAPTACHDYLRR